MAEPLFRMRDLGDSAAGIASCSLFRTTVLGVPRLNVIGFLMFACTESGLGVLPEGTSGLFADKIELDIVMYWLFYQVKYFL